MTSFPASLEKAMAPHSSTLAWQIPWREELGRLQSMGSLRVRHDWATSLSLFTFMHWRRKWQPIPVFLPGESQGSGAWWAAICGVAQSRTQLKQLSSSSSSSESSCRSSKNRSTSASSVLLVGTLLWYWKVYLGNEQRSFCRFWNCIQVLHFGLFCWPWWLDSCPQ